MTVTVDVPYEREPSATARSSARLFLDANLASLRLFEDTRAALLAAEPKGRVELLDDGTPCVITDSARLGGPLPLSDVLAQLAGTQAHDVVIVFGLGTGQVARAVRALTDLPIVIYEPDPGILRRVLEYGPLDLGGIPIVSNVADLTRVWREFSTRLVDVCAISTPGYFRAYPEPMRELAEAVPTLLQRTAISKATYQNRARAWIEDIIQNVELLTEAPPFLTLTGHFKGVPAFIIGAGPSLDKNIAALAEAAKKGIVFATNSGAVALAKHGVEPQVVCCIESIDASSKLQGLPFIDRAVRAFSLSAAPRTLRTGRGPLMPVHEAVAQYNGVLQELTGYGGLPMSGSVSTVAMPLARVLGCSPIVLVGQDLAYSGGRTYAAGTGYESSSAKVCETTGVIHLAWNDEALRVHGEAQGAPRTREELRRVPAWGGAGEVDSGVGFAGVHAWFESTAELIEKSGARVELINATEGGVHIEGYADVPLRAVLDGLREQDVTADSIARAARAVWTPLTPERIASWLEAQGHAAERVRRAARRVRRYAKYAATVTDGQNPALVTRTYDRLTRAEAELRRAVAQCPLVDAWSHRAVDEALAAMPGELPSMPEGPHRAAREATFKSARLAEAVEKSAVELERALEHSRVALPRL